MSGSPRLYVTTVCAVAVLAIMPTKLPAQSNPIADSALSVSTNAISSASIDYSKNTLNISINLVGGDRVTAVSLGGISLTFSTKATSIIANIPSGRFTPATYLLEVSTTKFPWPLLRPTFDVTYGAIGPQGPIGLQGPAGVPGPAGPKGAVGPAGPQGAQGVQGTTGAPGSTGAKGDPGPVGAKGDIGPQGSQGSSGAMGSQGLPGGSSHAYSATSAYAYLPLNGAVTVVSVPVPAGSYVVHAKTVISAPDGEGASCQLQLRSSSTILDLSVTQIGYSARNVLLVNESAATLPSPDTVLLVCGGDRGNAVATYVQLIAIQVVALN